MKFLRTLKKSDKKVEHTDHYIEKCGKCPDQLTLFCIRKKVFVTKDNLYEKCPLPDF